MLKILDGKLLAENVFAQIRSLIKNLPRPPGLTVIQVGANPDAVRYVRQKGKAASALGINFRHLALPVNISKKNLLAAIDSANNNPVVDGVIVQLPLPEAEWTNEIIAAIAPEKDADGFHPATLAKLSQGDETITPVLLRVVLCLLKEAGVKIKENSIVLVAKSSVFVKPFELAFRARGAVFTNLNPDDPLLTEKISGAETLIVAVGKPKFIATGVKPGATVIDIGINEVAGRLVGDVDFDAISKIAGAITPVPGGVGPLTVAYLLLNVAEAAERRINIIT